MSIAHVLDKGLYFRNVLLLVGFDTAAHIDAPGLNMGDGRLNVVGCETTGQDNWCCLRD